VLVHAALSGSLLAKEYAARSLANLAATEAARAELLCEGAATVLAALLKAQLGQLTGGKAAGAAAEQGSVAAAASCVLAAARALQNLSKSKAGCKVMLVSNVYMRLLCIRAILSSEVQTSGESICVRICSASVLQAELLYVPVCLSMVKPAPPTRCCVVLILYF
jgi:hypothetical protein